MKAYSIYKGKFLFPAILLFIILFAAACSSTKFIEENQSIVKVVEIDSIPSKYKEEAMNYIQKDIRPSSRLGINVGLYNIFYTLFKTKSVGKKAPVLDSTLVEISRGQIEKYLMSKGYFMAKVRAEIKVKNQRAQVDFIATTGPSFSIGKLSYTIPDPAVRKLYMEQKSFASHLHEGVRYDDDSLSLEREQIYQMMKEHGYYDFSRPYVRFEVDSSLNKSQANVGLLIDTPETGKHIQYMIGETNVIVAPSTEGFTDSITLNPRIYRGLRFTDLSKRFRRNPIVRYDFLKQGEVYDITKESLTYNRLYELNVFKNVKIEYIKPKDSSNILNPLIQLTPQKRMSNRVEGEIPFNAGTIGFTVGNTFTNNNIFKGAERFEFQIKGGLQSRIGQGGSLFNDIYQRDFSVSANLAVPRLMVPFNIPLMGKNGMPSTTFSSSYIYSLQKDFFVRRVLLNSITYDWVETKSKLHSFTPLNFEYRFGGLLLDLNTPGGLDIYNKNIYNLQLLTRKDLTVGMKYAYTLNANKLLLDKSFIYFRGNIDIAGNMLYGISRIIDRKHDPANGDYANILGLPFNQYVRPEVDIRWYKNLGVDKQFIARINAGVGYAYGNSVAIPFEKLFFAGGASGVRAWQARTLGPGNYNRGNTLTSEDQRKLSYGLDQLGQMHIEANLEYRYKLIDKFFGAKLKGAVFLDAGNVWNIAPGNPNPETYFKFKNLANQIGVGTGMGLRYDLQYFVFRFDVGLKLRDPQFAPADQWVITKLFSGRSEFQNAYNIANSPDTYRFFQYNFGIGLPF
ncbi:outer membrane protein assembly factor BamA [Pedobacter cryoconitis]|uniref:Outer membrane protein assembly factor BamA n=1 Tax=Pedobacter cryoconitis TaxID=188932 RepID=A0A7W8ZSH7_9SPHI|nr:BamA/TamA family outer membrane protein [Pedobacter cryoconitis]MBB5639155.1 outer membrane protein assembly factor BamA [Pedobacter cryoconitis]